MCLHVRDLDCVLSGHKIYTGSDRMSLLPIFCGSHYRHLVAHTRGYKLAREREKNSQIFEDCVVKDSTYRVLVFGGFSSSSPLRWLDPPSFICQGED